MEQQQRLPTINDAYYEHVQTGDRRCNYCAHGPEYHVYPAGMCYRCEEFSPDDPANCVRYRRRNPGQERGYSLR